MADSLPAWCAVCNHPAHAGLCGKALRPTGDDPVWCSCDGWLPPPAMRSGTVLTRRVIARLRGAFR